MSQSAVRHRNVTHSPFNTPPLLVYATMMSRVSSKAQVVFHSLPNVIAESESKVTGQSLKKLPFDQEIDGVNKNRGKRCEFIVHSDFYLVLKGSKHGPSDIRSFRMRQRRLFHICRLYPMMSKKTPAHPTCPPASMSHAIPMSVSCAHFCSKTNRLNGSHSGAHAAATSGRS